MELVTLLQYLQPLEAHILKGRLESEGIQCFVFDENLAINYPFAANLTGGAKLKVRAEDLERANEIISDKPHISSEE
jgi:hypothetical protein